MEEVDVLSRTESKQLKKQKYVDAMGPLSRGIKRLMDILAAISGMIVFSPLILWCYLAVKKEDGGPAIFSQERIGYKGKPFVLYKFRSMCIDSEASGPQLYAQGDSRLTKVGRFIREHHLDELPQLWNLLKGDMSMVGYRPERKEGQPLRHRSEPSQRRRKLSGRPDPFRPHHGHRPHHGGL